MALSNSFHSFPFYLDLEVLIFGYIMFISMMGEDFICRRNDNIMQRTPHNLYWSLHATRNNPHHHITTQYTNDPDAHDKRAGGNNASKHEMDTASTWAHSQPVNIIMHTPTYQYPYSLMIQHQMSFWHCCQDSVMTLQVSINLLSPWKRFTAGMGLNSE